MQKKLQGSIERTATSILFTTKVIVGRGKTIHIEAERFLQGELAGLVCVEASHSWNATSAELRSPKMSALRRQVQSILLIA